MQTRTLWQNTRCQIPSFSRTPCTCIARLKTARPMLLHRYMSQGKITLIRTPQLCEASAATGFDEEFCKIIAQEHPDLEELLASPLLKGREVLVKDPVWFVWMHTRVCLTGFQAGTGLLYRIFVLSSQSHHFLSFCNFACFVVVFWPSPASVGTKIINIIGFLVQLLEGGHVNKFQRICRALAVTSHMAGFRLLHLARVKHALVETMSRRETVNQTLACNLVVILFWVIMWPCVYFIFIAIMYWYS